jgi:hypothetical protein
MNGLQRTITVATLLGVAVFLHLFFCNWVIRTSNSSPPDYSGGVLKIVSFGPYSGILGRSPSSVSFDAIAGVAVPLLMVGGALYVAAGGRRSD